MLEYVARIESFVVQGHVRGSTGFCCSDGLKQDLMKRFLSLDFQWSKDFHGVYMLQLRSSGNDQKALLCELGERTGQRGLVEEDW